MDTKLQCPAQHNDFLANHCNLLITSFCRTTGATLIPEGLTPQQAAKHLFGAPFALLSHNASANPTFTYGNLKALELFETTWEELTNLPSRLSAEIEEQEARQKLLDEVSRNGHIKNYQGIRISRSGKRFQINNTIVWNLVDANGEYKGQAAAIYNWSDYL